MKKTLTVNLGGTVFNIDDDAYRLLDNYLSNLKMHFRKEAGADEIVDDIERRISELFAEKLSAGSQVITIADVEEVIARMGKPEDMEAEGESASADSGSTSAGGGYGAGAWNSNTAYFRVFFDYEDSRDIAEFFYSENGKDFVKTGIDLKTLYTLDHFMGYRIGIFYYASKTTGGHVDFKDFAYKRFS